MAQKDSAISSVHELTGLQEAIFAVYSELSIASPGAPPYNEQFSCRITGALDPGLLVQAWSSLSERHPALRTAFARTKDGKVVQVVLTSRQPHVLVTEDDSPGERDDIACRERSQRFDLARDPLLRVVLIEQAPQVWRMVVTFHHLIADAWSAPILIDDLIALYETASGLASTLPAPPRTTPGDFADALFANRGPANRAYWEATLKCGEIARLPFLDASRPAGRKECLKSFIPKQTASQLSALAQRLEISESAILHALWGLLLGRLTGTSEPIFATVLANRSHDMPDIERVIGMFIVTVPVKVSLSDNPGFAETCQALHQQLAIAPHWSSPPLADMLAAARLQASELDHMMNGRPSGLAWGDLEQLSFPRSGLLIDDYRAESWDHYDFQIGFTLGRAPFIEARFDSNRIERAQLSDILEAAQALLANCLDDPSAPITSRPLSAHTGPRLSILEGPSRMLDRALPDLIAEVPGERLATSDRWCRLSYSELRSRAESLAARMAATGVVAGSRVALSTRPRTDLLAQILATWMLGASFVPINPAWSEERRSRILAAARPTIQLGLEDAVEALDRDDTKALGMAYRIFTSGSTGTPKGVDVSLRALTNYCISAIDRLGLKETDRALQVTSAAFDLGYTTAFGLLAVGGSVFWADREDLVDPNRVLRLMAEHEISVLKMTPSFLTLMLSAPDPSLFRDLTHWRLIILGGESPNLNTLSQLGTFCPWLQLAFHYGPTEATIGCTMTKPFPISRIGEIDSADIGSPVLNTRIKILDPFGQPVPRGIAGELTVFGEALAEGYAQGDTGFIEIGRERAFRTGDQAVMGRDGTLRLLGRLDERAKIRGHWVSPSDTRKALIGLPEVEDAAVSIREHNGETQLVAFVAVGDRAVSPSQLRSGLRESLLDAQIPCQFYFLSRLLMTENGKLDTSSMIASAKPAPGGSGVEKPTTPTERLLAEIWCDVLGVEGISRQDDFFVIGGHSLKAIEVSARLARSGHSTVPLHTFFEAPRLMDLALRIDGDVSGNNGGVFPLLDTGTAASVLCFPATIGSASIYRETLDLMGISCSVDGLEDADRFDQTETLEEMVREMLVCATATGNDYKALLGWSFGASLVFESARQLEHRGHRPQLIMIDGLPADPDADPNAAMDDFQSLAMQRYWSTVLRKMTESLGASGLERYQQQLRGRRKKLMRYRFGGPLRNDILFIAADPSGTIEPDRRQRIEALSSGDVRIKVVAADHFSLFHPPHVHDWIGEVRGTIS
ncbi:Phenylalanine racemase (ATP-hydrolyzing) [Thiorhodococcus drewsii AZ1]|uniref:Phenylalanine racemase (ATP-hydrolyzing) n=1 Tax=Thiorhodococcus drewsii AZ1 TaxID=765913 RepID=G2E5C8_9GAMM|nr:AMP-binding protein [Thiorhodococcus drewsii]EGV28840.1 Phenylalanine racemase (ATP-hydrolyzing) [Thiorhodococcus drewsii AZ1]